MMKPSNGICDLWNFPESGTFENPYFEGIDVPDNKIGNTEVEMNEVAMDEVISLDKKYITSTDESDDDDDNENDTMDNTNGVDENKMQKLCIRIGCSKKAVDSPDWDFEFCSNFCAVSHCKLAFENWVSQRKSEQQ